MAVSMCVRVYVCVVSLNYEDRNPLSIETPVCFNGVWEIRNYIDTETEGSRRNATPL